MSECLKSECHAPQFTEEETEIPRGNDAVFLKPDSSSHTRCPRPELLGGDMSPLRWDPGTSGIF